MELVLDNIKMLHMNKKLIDYTKRQFMQSNLFKNRPIEASGEVAAVPTDE